MGETETGVRSYAEGEWVVNVDVSVGVGGKWTWRVVSKTDGHAANGNGSRGSGVGMSR